MGIKALTDEYHSALFDSFMCAKLVISIFQYIENNNFKNCPRVINHAEIAQQGNQGKQADSGNSKINDDRDKEKDRQKNSHTIDKEK